MNITIGNTAGFCNGVRLAIKKVEDTLGEYNEVYSLGEIIHNNQVIEKLSAKGLKTVENISDIPDNSVAIVRAHGTIKSDYEEAKKRNIKIVDATCGKVLAIHKKVEEKAGEGCYIVIVGKRNHPETIGTISFAGDNYICIEKDDEDEILDAVMQYDMLECDGSIFICAQTTFNRDVFEKIVYDLEAAFCELNVEKYDSICDATRIRQEECKKLAKESHTMVIIGGKQSSNTRELYNIAKKECDNAYLIETYSELENIDIDIEKPIGIMAGASTPQDSIDDVVNYLNSLN